jgi:hypothetical protein
MTRRFIISVVEGEPQWTLLGCPESGISLVVQWKLPNMRRMAPTKHLFFHKFLPGFIATSSEFEPFFAQPQSFCLELDLFFFSSRFSFF